jgi:site-specific DNA-cytosine methylase
MANVYRIAKWLETFETSDSRRNKTLSWVSWPLDSTNGYNDLVETFGDEAPLIYGAWCALVRFAAEPGMKQQTYVNHAGVRRLTPRECERLQGFPDDWTRYDAEGNEIADSARYRMCGNAVAVPVVEWIGRRIVAATDSPNANPPNQRTK